MEMEIEELKRQRDLAESQVEELRRKLQDDQQVSHSLSIPPPPPHMHTHAHTQTHVHTHFFHMKQTHTNNSFQLS